MQALRHEQGPGSRPRKSATSTRTARPPRSTTVWRQRHMGAFLGNALGATRISSTKAGHRPHARRGRRDRGALRHRSVCAAASFRRSSISKIPSRKSHAALGRRERVRPTRYAARHERQPRLSAAPTPRSFFAEVRMTAANLFKSSVILSLSKDQFGLRCGKAYGTDPSTSLRMTKRELFEFPRSLELSGLTEGRPA